MSYTEKLERTGESSEGESGNSRRKVSSTELTDGVYGIRWGTGAMSRLHVSRSGQRHASTWYRWGQNNLMHNKNESEADGRLIERERVRRLAASITAWVIEANIYMRNRAYSSQKQNPTRCAPLFCFWNEYARFPRIYNTRSSDIIHARFPKATIPARLDLKASSTS
jgi:hypothetical protein